MRPVASCAAFALLLGLVVACASSNRGPRVVEATREEALAATRVQDWNQASVRWYSLFQRDPENGLEACRESARAFLQLNDAQLANRVLDQGLKLFPYDPDLLELRGKALTKQGFLRAAADSLERALDVDPERASAALELGDVNMRLGLEGAAATAFERAIARGMDTQEAWTRLARARKSSGDVVGALEAWKSAFDKGAGKTEDLLLAAQTAVDPLLNERRAEDLTLGVSWLEQIIEREPNHVIAHFQLGVLCEATEQDERAILAYRRAIELDPANLISLRNLAVLYHQLGNREGVREIVERALSIEQDPERRQALSKLLDEAPPEAGT